MQVHSDLDSIELVQKDTGEHRVVFNAEVGKEAVILGVRDGVAKVLMSSCMPVRGWKGYAYAYQRALVFVQYYSLRDSEDDDGDTWAGG